MGLQLKDGECLKWLDVGQGLRQGYALHVALQRFSEDAYILGNLVHLNESSKGVGSETTLDTVMRAV